MAKKKLVYVEPVEYFPKHIRKEFGLGEYAEINTQKGKRESEIKESGKIALLKKEEEADE